MSLLAALCTPARSKKSHNISSRGRSNFKQYSKDQQRVLGAKYPFLSAQQIHKKVSMQWKQLTQNEKQTYHCMAKV